MVVHIMVGKMKMIGILVVEWVTETLDMRDRIIVITKVVNGVLVLAWVIPTG